MAIRKIRATFSPRHLVGFLISACVVFGWGTVSAAGPEKVLRVQQDFSATPSADFVPDEFIVVLTPQARGAVGLGTDAAGRPTTSIPSLQGLLTRLGVAGFTRQFPNARPQASGSKFHDLTGHYKVKLPAAANLGAVMSAFAQDPHVASVEKIGIHPVYACASGTPRNPNDTWFDDPPATFDYPQYDLWDTWGIDANRAWSVETGDPGVVVVAMDTGTRYTHGDLGGTNPPGPSDSSTNGNIWVNPNETPGNGVDDDGNGKVDDIVGWDFVTSASLCSAGEDCSVEDNDPMDFNGHGTHVAGTMAAITNNGRGIAGIAGGFNDGTGASTADGAKILVARVGYESPFGGLVNMASVAQAMAYVTDLKVNHGINIVAVNASWGSSNSGGLGVAVDNLLAADIMLIHAAGNGGTSSTDYLGSRSDVMNVAATDQNGVKASFSNYGSWVDVAAPGVDIISTYHNSSDPTNDYVAALSGTSMAAPHVAGVAALLEVCNPNLTGPQKFGLIVANTCPPNSSSIGGLLNAKRALDAAGCSGGCTNDDQCSDGNACNGSETCVAGSCQAGTPLSCDDSDACTTDTCDSDAGCVHGPVVCNDGDLCTTDTCNATSGCSFGPVTCEPGLQCDSGTGLCVEPPVCDNDGTCESGEDCDNCSNDCVSGTASGAVCGNGICEAGNGEDCVSCPADCNGKQGGKPSGRFCCGGGENPVLCADFRCTSGGFQCTETPVAPGGSFCCGNEKAEAGETCINCPLDVEALEICADGIDNDCDGFVDCDDSDCTNDNACATPSCTVKGDPCTTNDQCCSNKCKNGACR